MVTLFLMPKLNQRCPEAEGAEARLPVVSHNSDIGLDWEPDETRDVNSLVVRLRTIR